MEETFFKLLSDDNNLKKQHKYLKDEDSEAFEIFLKFLVTIEENLHYSEKEEYINLAKEFLDEKITADDFCYSFLAIYEGINAKLNQLKNEESVELAKFITKVNRSELNPLLAKIYGSCDNFGLDPESYIINQKELKNYAKVLLLQLQQ